MVFNLGSLEGPALQRMIAIVGAVAFLLQGYNQSMMNGLLTMDEFLKVIPEADTLNTAGAVKSHNAKIQGLIVAIYEIGCALGALSCLVIGDRLGRPKTMYVAGLVVLVGVVIQICTYSLGQILAARIITGLGIGAYTGTVPMYVSETADAKMRGPLVLIEGVFALSGITLAAWINFGFYHVPNSSEIKWRFPIAFQLVFLLILLGLQWFLPESPRWLMKKERREEGAAAVARLRCLPIDSPEVIREVSLIHMALMRDQGHRNEHSASPFSMNNNRHLHRTLLAVTITMITQMTGINIIPFYSNTILQGTLGYPGDISRILSACMQLTLVCGGITACFLVERIGRRRLMLMSTFSIGLCQAAVGGLSSNLSNPACGKAALFFYFLAMYVLPVGMFMIPFMYASEIAPIGIRHQVAGMAAASSWTFNFLVAEITPVAFADITWRYYFVFFSCSMAGCVIIYLFYPETRGLPLEAVDMIFTESKSVLDPVRVAKELPETLDFLEDADLEK
ncbi:general substrate transporter [Thozetella sp. PMI_491]|nr:general substrate transporter [Thozetella sp. PMI_491]